MYALLATFGLAFFVAGIFIYPRPTLFIAVFLFVFLAFLGQWIPDDEDTDSE